MPSFSESAVFWILIYSATISVVATWVFARYRLLHQRGKELTWDIHTEYIDIAEFSNRNIPLKVTYKGTEPRWLWATYLTLRNTGTETITNEDTPDRQGFTVGAEGCRYIGFNKLISDKAKVALRPLFRGTEHEETPDVYAKLEFDRLGPGDEILVSLLYVADERRRVNFEGVLFGAYSKVASGYHQRMHNWRALWWLLFGTIIAGALAGWATHRFLYPDSATLLYQLAALLLVYCVALITAAVLLRPIYNWQQLLDRFVDHGSRRERSLKQLRFLLGFEKEV
jgi:hypothetical protein